MSVENTASFGQVQRLLERLDGVTQVGPGQWRARCPAHQDGTPSLYIALRSGRILIHDFGGCPTERVLNSLGLKWSDLFLDEDDHKAAPGGRSISYEIRDLKGELIAVHVRIDQLDGSKTFHWLRNGRKGLGGLKTALLPLYGSQHLNALPDGATVVVVEGEKAADSLWERGVIAVGTVCGANVVPEDAVLEPLVRLDPVLWADNDPPGQKHMELIARALRRLGGKPRWVEWAGAPEKGDAADFAGTTEELQALIREAQPWEPSWPGVFSARELLETRFPPPAWVVPELIPAGLTILAGKPKVGKSWLVLGLSLAVAHGGRALGQIPVERGDVLYLALEDTRARLQARLRFFVADGEAVPMGLRLATFWPRLDDGGLAQLEDYLAAYPDTRLVVVDTLARVRAPHQGRGDLYLADYGALEGLQDLSRRTGVAILVVHHQRKSGALDPIDVVSGTAGLTAAPDTVMVLNRSRGQADAELFVMARDVNDLELALRFDPRVGWVILGHAEEWRISRQRREILEAIRSLGGEASPKEIADALNKKPGQVRYLLYKMSEAGTVQHTGRGRYTITPNIPNDANIPINTNTANIFLSGASMPPNDPKLCSERNSSRNVSAVSGVSHRCPSCGRPVQAGEADEHGRCPQCAAEDLVPW